MLVMSICLQIVFNKIYKNPYDRIIITLYMGGEICVDRYESLKRCIVIGNPE